MSSGERAGKGEEEEEEEEETGSGGMTRLLEWRGDGRKKEVLERLGGGHGSSCSLLLLGMVCWLLLLAGSGWVDDGVEVHLGAVGATGEVGAQAKELWLLQDSSDGGGWTGGKNKEKVEAAIRLGWNWIGMIDRKSVV